MVSMAAKRVMVSGLRVNLYSTMFVIIGRGSVLIRSDCNYNYFLGQVRRLFAGSSAEIEVLQRPVVVGHRRVNLMLSNG